VLYEITNFVFGVCCFDVIILVGLKIVILIAEIIRLTVTRTIALEESRITSERQRIRRH